MLTIKLLLCFTLLFLCACSNKKDLYNLNFPTMMHIDYVDEKFNLSIQLLNASLSSSNELESSIIANEIMICKGSGNSLSLALSDLEKTLRTRIDLTKVNTITISPSVLENHMHELLNMMVYEESLNHHVYIYVVEKDIDKIMTIKHKINSTPYFSFIASNSEDEYNFTSQPPVLLEVLKSSLNDHYILIPNLTIYSNNIGFKEGKLNEVNTSIIDSVYFYNKNNSKKIYMNDLQGLFYLTNSSYNKGYKETILCDNPIHYTIEKCDIKDFNIDVYIRLASHYNESEKIIHDYIHDLVSHTYSILLSNNIDYLNNGLKDDDFNIDLHIQYMKDYKEK